METALFDVSDCDHSFRCPLAALGRPTAILDRLADRVVLLDFGPKSEKLLIGFEPKRV